MATAIYAVSAALVGAWSFADRACRIKMFGSEVTSLQAPSVSTWRISFRFFGVNPDRRYSSSVALISSRRSTGSLDADG
jgi:hypothetical protein